MSLKKAYLIILASFVWLVGMGTLFNVIAPPSNSALANALGGSMLLGFAVIFLVGTAVWAGAKGYHPLLGAFLGWLGPLGLLILVCLHDKSEKSQ
jgi:Kef-type K+ transport system membrane component KefB